MQVRTVTSLRLLGSKGEIQLILRSLSTKGFEWKSNGKYYSQRDDSKKFAYYLNYLYIPLPDMEEILENGQRKIEEKLYDRPVDDEPKPQPFDVVLGGKGKLHTHSATTTHQ